MTSPRRLACLAATLLSGLAAAGPAQAAVPGLNVSAYDDATRALETGAKQIRFFVPWKNFEPSRAPEFSELGPVTANPLTTGLKTNVDRVRAAGATPIMVILDAPDWASGGGIGHKHPRDPAEYAAFVGELATWLRAEGPAPVYEVWNEPDAEKFWGGTPDPVAYTALLRASHRTIKAADPRATVLAGPTTGNNFHWIESLYASGAKGSFDGVGVHTDTGCSIVGPDSFYREPDGRIGQYTFLGYREVRRVMLAAGDDKPIWMTELGWGTTGKRCTISAPGDEKLAGVTEAQQAAFLTKAYQCMAHDPYVVAGAWFSLRDDTTNPNDESHFGLLRSDGSAKPSLAAFATAGVQGAAECGDFEPPALEVVSPFEGQRFVDKLDLSARASDPGVGIARISYAFDGAKEIRNFTQALGDGVSVGLSPWLGSGALAVGPHTVEVSALDKNANLVTKTVNVVKVAPGSLAATLVASFRLPKKVSCKGRTCSVRSSLARPAGGSSVNGKVAVQWEFKNKRDRFRKLVGGLKPASKPSTFKAKLKFRGAWRVRLVYKGIAPYKSVTSKYLYFRVR